MEVTLNLPENVYRNFSKIAEEKHLRVEEVITDKLLDDFSVDGENYGEKLRVLAFDYYPV